MKTVKMKTASELIVLNQKLDELYKQERYTYEQMNRYRDDPDRTKYSEYMRTHDVILADIDNIVVRLREIKEMNESKPWNRKHNTDREDMTNVLIAGLRAMQSDWTMEELFSVVDEVLSKVTFKQEAWEE